MKQHILTFCLTCLFLLSPNVVMSETVKYEDLVERGGLSNNATLQIRAQLDPSSEI